MEINETLLRGRLALEAAEQAVGALLELERDPELVELRASLRRNCDRIQAVQVDRAIRSERERELASAR